MHVAAVISTASTVTICPSPELAGCLSWAPAAHRTYPCLDAGASALIRRAPSHTPSDGDSGNSVPASHAASRSLEVQPPVAEHSELSLAGNLEAHLEEGAAAAAAAQQSQAAVGILHASGLVLVQYCTIKINAPVTSGWHDSS